MNDQLHALAALLRGKEPAVSVDRRLGVLQAGLNAVEREMSCRPTGSLLITLVTFVLLFSKRQ
jgi:hypothetical protein